MAGLKGVQPIFSSAGSNCKRELIHVLHANKGRNCKRKGRLHGAGEKRRCWSIDVVEVLLELLTMSLLKVIV
jgi:hypothetical protein